MVPEQLQPAKLNPLVCERLRGLCGSGLSSFPLICGHFSRSEDPAAAPGAARTPLRLRVINATPMHECRTHCQRSFDGMCVSKKKRTSKRRIMGVCGSKATRHLRKRWTRFGAAGGGGGHLAMTVSGRPGSPVGAAAAGKMLNSFRGVSRPLRAAREAPFHSAHARRYLEDGSTANRRPPAPLPPPFGVFLSAL